MADESAINSNDFISEDALKAPLIMSENIDKLIKQLNVLIGNVRNTSATIKDNRATLTDVNKATAALTQSETELIGIQTKLTKSIKDETTAFVANDKELKKLREDFAKLRTETERQTKEGQKLLKTIQDQTKELNKLKTANKEAASSSQNMSEAFNALDSRTGGVLSNLKRIGGELLTIAKSPFFLAAAAIIGAFTAMKKASDAYYESTLKGEEDLLISEAKNKAFFQAYEKRWEEAGEKISYGFEQVKSAWRALIQEVTDAYSDDGVSEATKEQRKAEEKLIAIEKERARLSKEHLRDRIDDANTELKVIELLEIAKDKEEYTAEQRLAAQLKGGEILRKQEEGDLELAKRDLELQKDIIAQLSEAKGGVYDRTKSLVDLTDEEIRQIGVKGEEIDKLAALEEAYVKVESGAAAKRVTRLKLELAIKKEVVEEERKQAEFNKLLATYRLERRDPGAQGDPPLEQLKKYSAERTEIEIKGANARVAVAKKELDAKVAFLERYQQAVGEYIKLENIAGVLGETYEVYNEFYNALGNLQTTFTSNVLQDIQKQSQALADQKANELKIAGDNADAKRAIEERYTVEDKKLKREQAKQINKQATFEKLTALVQAGIKESLLIIEALLFPTPTKIAAAVAGGIQVAAIAAKQAPPAYEKGTKDAAGGVALVGEKGAELVKEPDGTEYLTPAKPTYMYIPKHSEVIPTEETMRRIALGAAARFDRAPNKDELSVLATKLDKQTRVIENKKFLNVNITEGGVRLVIQQAARREHRLGSTYL